MGDLLKSATALTHASARGNVHLTKNDEARLSVSLSTTTGKTEQSAKTKFDPKQQQEAMQKMVERLNQLVKETGRDLQFSLDERIDTFIIVVKNTNSGEVVRQIPSEAAVKMAHSIEDMKGILFNEEF